MSTGSAYETLLHEIGHAMGLKHPHDSGSSHPTPPYLNAEGNTSNTIMSYNNKGAFNDKLAHYDVAILEYMYGLNDNYRAGADTYVYNSQDILSDGGGSDTIDASSVGDDLTIDLHPGSWNYTGDARAKSILADGQLFIGYDTVIENVKTGAGDDYIIGNEVSNTIIAGGGADIISAGAGGDTIKSGAGSDTVSGGEGDDKLIGGTGNDVLVGGAGSDIFLFDVLDGSVDTIEDFTSSDKIQLDSNIFTALDGLTASEAFSSNNLDYNSSTGELLYDSDGAGSADSIHIATLNNHFDLTEHYIEIIA